MAFLLFSHNHPVPHISLFLLLTLVIIVLQREVSSLKERLLWGYLKSPMPSGLAKASCQKRSKNSEPVNIGFEVGKHRCNIVSFHV